MEKAPYEPQDEIFEFLRPGIAVDVVLLTVLHDDLKVALTQRQDEPYFGKFALPGRFVRYEEPIEETARKALEKKGNIITKNIYLEQLHTFGQNLIRDTRIRTISIVYYALLPPEEISSQKGNTFTWFSAYDLPELAFDHTDIINHSLKKIRDKLFSTDVVFRLMPAEFTLPDLQMAYEVLLNEELDKRNFRKKIKDLFILKDTHKTRMEGAHRPAKLYAYEGISSS